MKSYQQFLAELKRRHVFKVAGIYGIVAFGVLQAAELMLPRLGVPDWTVTFMVALVVLGFPVALILAWAFELTPDGVRKAEQAAPGVIEGIVAQPASKRWPAGLMALVGIGALVAGAWWAGIRTGRGEVEAVAGASMLRADSVQLAFVDPAADERPSIAVLPFANMSADPDQEYFSDGITEELLNTLAKIRRLRVAARTSAFAFKGQQVDLRQVGDSLGVAYLIEGSVRKAGNRLRITVQLIDASDGSHLWSEQYDREMIDVFAIQTEIAEAIAAELRVPLGLDEGERLVSPTEDLAAYDLYLAGRAMMRERGKAIFEAARLFEAATARDSNWAPAWAGLAESLALRPFYGPGPDEPQVAPDSAYWANSLDAAEAAARKALALDPDNASATVALANAMRDRWEWEDAEQAYLRALALDPDNVEAHMQYAEYLAYVGRNDEAHQAARRALSLDPSPIRFNVAGYTAHNDARIEEAIDYYRRGIAADTERNIRWLLDNLLSVYVQTGRWIEAREIALAMGSESSPELASRILETWPASGERPIEFNPDILIGVSSFDDSPGTFWMALGRPEKALAFLDLLRQEPPFGYTNILFDPAYDPLRDDPRFKDLMRIRGLEGRQPIRSNRSMGEAP